MRCIYCGDERTHVTRTTPLEDNTTRREHRCRVCKNKWYTRERVETIKLFVLKSTGIKEPYNPTKLRESIEVAAGKPGGKHSRLRVNAIDSILGSVEGKIVGLARQRGTMEIDSKEIGKLVLEELRDKDYGAFLRYLSVFSNEILQNEELRTLIDQKFAKGIGDTID